MPCCARCAQVYDPAKEEAAAAAAANLPEPQGTGAVQPGSNLGPLGPKYWLPLQANERILQARGAATLSVRKPRTL